MPKNKSALIRYRIIDTCLTNKQRPFPTLEYLAEKCAEKLGTDISASTIEKDLRAMKRSYPHGFDAPIIYNKERKGYAYGEQGFSIAELQLEQEEWDSLRYAANLLYQYAEVPIFKDFKQAIEKIDARFSLQLDVEDDSIQRHVQFESGNATTGYQWLSVIYPAISSKWLLNLQYENIYKHETKTYQVVPYLLKENRNRWYLIGWVEDRQDYLTFALDRIQDINIIKQKQKLKTDFNPEVFLQHSVGIMKNEGKPSKVILELKDPYHKLIQLEPIHTSQKIIKTKNDGIQIELAVYINQELYNRILSMSSYCKVIQPASLKKIISEHLEAAAEQYR